MLLLASDFPVDSIKSLIPKFEEARVIDHVYATETVFPTNELLWKRYVKGDHSQFAGSIWFSKNADVFIPEFVEIVEPWLREKTGLVINARNIFMMKTVGSIPIHIDEAGRRSVINIGIDNSSGAKTIFYDGGNRDSRIVAEGEAYLMNVKSPHSVEAINLAPRYLVSYSMATEYQDVLTLINR